MHLSFFFSYKNAQICFTSSIPAASACWVTKLVWDAYRRAWRTQAIPAVLGWPCQTEVAGSQSLTLGVCPQFEGHFLKTEEFRCISLANVTRLRTEGGDRLMCLCTSCGHVCLFQTDTQLEQTLFISFALLSLLFGITLTWEMITCSLKQTLHSI